MSVPGPIRFGDTDSLLVFAPHPDDETLAAGGLMQRAHDAGARVHITVVSDGENNPWPQRFFERRLRIGDAGRRRLARRRRIENDRAITLLRLRRATRSSLAVADRGVTSWLLADARSAVARFADEFRRHRPTMVVTPSLEDLHPDHSAVAMLVELVVATDGQLRNMNRLCYTVHCGLRAHSAHSSCLSLSADELRRKRSAIEAYESQLVFRGRFYRSFARADECFEDPSSPRIDLRVEVPSDRRVIFAGVDFYGRPFATTVDADVRRSEVPYEVARPLRRVFWKRPARWLLFDRHGWREALLPVFAEPRVRETRSFAESGASQPGIATVL